MPLGSGEPHATEDGLSQTLSYSSYLRLAELLSLTTTITPFFPDLWAIRSHS
ncbi:MAG: hypothetical protein M3R24_40075 [Chloroflexota bacterium]|nr:hypothetical protein [Chloroflexota bacterium]